MGICPPDTGQQLNVAGFCIDIGFGTLVHPGDPMGGYPPRYNFVGSLCRQPLSIPFRQSSREKTSLIERIRTHSNLSEP